MALSCSNNKYLLSRQSYLSLIHMSKKMIAHIYNLHTLYFQNQNCYHSFRPIQTKKMIDQNYHLYHHYHLFSPIPKMSGDRCTISLLMDSRPSKFKMDKNLAQLFAPYQQFYQSKPAIMSAIWQYIKTNKLQDSNNR